MQRQGSFADLEASGQRRRTRRERLPGQTGAIVPRGEWVAPVESHYPDGRRGRRPVGCERMPGMYLLQVWFHLSDEACEDAVLDSRAMQRFVGIDMMSGQVPDATTLPEFRHLPGGRGSGRGCSPSSSPSRAGAASSCAVAPSSTPPSPGPPPRRGTGSARATRRPTRLRRATTGTSGTRRTRASTRGRASRARWRSPPRTCRTWPWRRRRRAPTTGSATPGRATRARGGAGRPPAGPRPPGPLGGHPGDREAPPGGPGAPEGARARRGPACGPARGADAPPAGPPVDEINPSAYIISASLGRAEPSRPALCRPRRLGPRPPGCAASARRGVYRSGA